MLIVRAVLLIVLCLPLSGFDAINNTVEILPHWKTGDSFDLTITRAREKSVDGRSALTGKTHTRFAVQVLSADADGYLLGWTAGDTTFEDPSPSESFLRQVVGIMKGMQIVLILDRQGTIRGVQNWEALRSETVKVMDALLTKTADSPQGNNDHRLMSNLRAQWETMFTTKEQVEQLCTRDARIYFKVLGRRYRVNEPYEYPDLLPNPLGGEPFPTRARILLKTFDQQSGQAMLSWKQAIDPKAAARILESMIKDLAARRGKKTPDGEFAKAISMEDHADIEVDVRTGWVTRFTRTQSVNLGTRGQTDMTSIVKSAK